MAQTYRQYEQACRASATKEYGMSGREYDECYPPGSRLPEWIEDTVAEAQRGVVLPVTVLDDLVTREPKLMADLYRDYRVTLPEDYEPPHKRREPGYQKWRRWRRQQAAP